jgi:hypothetical protein
MHAPQSHNYILINLLGDIGKCEYLSLHEKGEIMYLLNSEFRFVEEVGLSEGYPSLTQPIRNMKTFYTLLYVLYKCGTCAVIQNS